MSEMPEKVRLIEEGGILKFPADTHGTEYIRADLVAELVKALREARDDMEAWQGYASAFMHEKHDAAGDLAKIDAALSRAKGGG